MIHTEFEIILDYSNEIMKKFIRKKHCIHGIIQGYTTESIDENMLRVYDLSLKRVRGYCICKFSP
jgi:hypothetical protein